MANTDKLVERIRKLLALADKAKNTNANEAEAAMLKAQQLMAEYGVTVEGGDTPEAHTYKLVRCETPGDKGFRISLCAIIANNFRCKAIIESSVICFLGREADAEICKAVFEFAYKFAKKHGDREVARARKEHRDTKCVFNSYATGFLIGLKEKLGEQSTALMIVTPPDVKEEFERQFPSTKVYKGGMQRQRCDYDSFAAGVIDGKRVMNERNEHLG